MSSHTMSQPSQGEVAGRQSRSGTHPTTKTTAKRQSKPVVTTARVPPNASSEAVQEVATQLQSVQITNHYEKTIMTGNARGILGNFYQTHHHIYSDGSPGPIDIDASSTAEFLHTVLAAVDKYKRTQNEAAWAEAGEEWGTLIAETLSEPSSRASVAAPLVGTHQLTSVTGNVQEGRERSQQQIQRHSQWPPDTSSEPEVAQQITPANTIRHPLSSASVAASRGFQGLSDRYKQRNGSFFDVGRVFATLWSEHSSSTMTREEIRESELNGKDLNLTLAPVGINVSSHIRRFIVVMKRDGYCRCVAITTHGGKGLLKQGLTSREIRSHAILYDSNSHPTRLRHEPATSQRPLAVDMADGQTLAGSSLASVYLAKLYCVEWNIKVMDIGKVCRRDLPHFLASVEAEIFGEM